MSFDAHAPGTSTQVWEADPRVTAATPVDLTALRELVVVAAHPDDETLGAGGLMALASEAGIPVRVIVVTDGAASHPFSPTTSPETLRTIRAREVRDAVGRLAPGATVELFGFADGRTFDEADEVASRLAAALSSSPDAHVVAPWVGDGHSDHRMVGTLVGQVLPPTATLWGYPIWMWHWAEPEVDEIPWERAVSVSLTSEALSRKRDAIGRHVSQILPLSDAFGDEALLETGVLEHFTRSNEIFFTVRSVA